MLYATILLHCNIYYNMPAMLNAINCDQIYCVITIFLIIDIDNMFSKTYDDKLIIYCEKVFNDSLPWFILNQLLQLD